MEVRELIMNLESISVDAWWIASFVSQAEPDNGSA
jgi:hypothetical protein